MKNYKEMTERLEAIRSRMNEIHGEHEDTDLPEALRSEWADLDTEASELEESIKEIDARRSRVANTSTRENGFSGFNVSHKPSDIWSLDNVRSYSTEDLRERAKFAVEAIDFANDAQRSSVEELVNRDEDGAVAQRVIGTGSPTYRNAFVNYVRNPHNVEAMRSMESYTNADGGFAIPVQIDPTFIRTSAVAINPLRGIATVKTITSNVWKGVTATGVSMAYVPEGTEAGASSTPTLAQPSVTPERFQGYATYTLEVEQDLAGVVEDLGVLFAEAKDSLEADKFLNGAGHGSNEPQGLLTGLSTSQRVQTATVATFAEADLYSLENGLPIRWQGNAKIVAHKQAYNAVRAFGKGNDLWTPLAGSAVGRGLIGYQTYEMSGLASNVSTTGNKIMLIGDFSKFLIVDRLGMSVNVIPFVFGANGRPTGERGLYIIGRNSSAVLVADAFRYLEVK